jgi:hypothetical protein
MQPEARQIHVRWTASGIKPGQYIPQFAGVLRSHAANAVVLIKALQPFVTNRPDHVRS